CRGTARPRKGAIRQEHSERRARDVRAPGGGASRYSSGHRSPDLHRGVEEVIVTSALVQGACVMRNCSRHRTWAMGCVLVRGTLAAACSTEDAPEAASAAQAPAASAPAASGERGGQ